MHDITSGSGAASKLSSKGGLSGDGRDNINGVQDDSAAPVADVHSKGVLRQAREWARDRVRGGLFHKPIGPSKDGRRIPLRVADRGSQAEKQHQRQQYERLIDERRGTPYISNAIRTSRYTLYDFFPKQVWFQFSRLSNFYFLCVGVPQTIPGISTTGNFTTILPLLFFVLLTIFKEGYDDYKRHRLDKVENALGVTVLRPVGAKHSDSKTFLPGWLGRLGRWSRSSASSTGAAEQDSGLAGDGFEWRKIHWRDVEVGDIVKLTRDEDVPADMVLLQAENEDHIAYVETMALDGETSLKSKTVPTDLKNCSSLSELLSGHVEFVLEDPNPDLYRFDGRVTVDSRTSPLTINEVFYRGSTLRNTPTALGMVINTGEECKLRKNANRHPRAKKPALENVTNRIVLSLVAYVFSLTAGCSVGYLLWQRYTENYAWYLRGAGVAVQEIVVGYAIHFNNIIPLSLYVTLEITKIFQMLMLNGDIEMYDEESDTPAKCNTNTILENLGQVGYVFSDKTGTLTENVMKFRKLSIAGTSWLHEMDLRTPDDQGHDHDHQPTSIASPIQQRAPVQTNTLKAPLAGRRSVAIPEGLELSPCSSAIPLSPMSPITANRRSSSHWRSTGRPDHTQPDLTTDDLLEYMHARPNSPFARAATDYLLALALCHTCLPEAKDGQIEYQAASPDELALVKAAQELGFLVLQRSSQSITVRIAGGDSQQGIEQVDEVYEILDVIEFSSKRKRMSIIVRCPDGRLLLICKGADSIILPRLKMAHLAIQKANEVRQSAELERELLRKSEQHEARNSISLGGRASLTIHRRSYGGVHHAEAPAASSSSKRPVVTSRGKSFEAASWIRRSADLIHPSLKLRTMSFDVTRSSSNTGGNIPITPLSPRPLLDKFSFLDDPSISDDGTIFTRCFQHLDDFATEGLRTLLYSQRTLSESEYASWKKLYHDATTSLVDRQERIEAVGDMIEQNLSLVGASAIEDKLQKGVPETVDKLRRAGIRIWMLTGDKRETAVNIAHSARICKPSSEIHILDSGKGDIEAQLLDIIEELRGQQEEAGVAATTPFSARRERHHRHHHHAGPAPALNHTVVVVDGHTLAEIELSPALSALFFSLTPTVDSVICCRASPAQKALLVRSVRQRGKEASSGPAWLRHETILTLSIGDGGNDLAMLSEAHVGVGISGREGLQAARVADYSVAQFRFLARLLLVHGRWNYGRTARFVLATFWKEMFFYTGTVAYQLFVGYTGTSLYEMWSLTVLNVLFTSLCTIIPALWEQDLSAATLLAVPELYSFGQQGLGLNLSKYVGWMLAAVAEGLFMFVCCWVGLGVYGSLTGETQGLYALGNLVFSVAMMWTNWKLLIIETHNKNAVVFFSFFITTGGWWAWQAFLAAVYTPQPSPYAVRNSFRSGWGSDLCWWLVLVVVVASLVVVETAYKAVKRQVVVVAGPAYRRKLRGLRAWLGSFAGWRRGGGGRGRGGKGLFAGGAAGVAAAAGAGAGDGDDLAEEADWSVELWQELEQDPVVRARLEAMCWEDEDGADEDHDLEAVADDDDFDDARSVG